MNLVVSIPAKKVCILASFVLGYSYIVISKYLKNTPKKGCYVMRKKIFENFFRSVLLVLGITCLFKTGVLAENIPVYLDNQQVKISNEIFIEDGQVMVPLRAICEALGYDVKWDAWYYSNDWFPNGDWCYKIFISKLGQIPYVFDIDSRDVYSIIREGRTYTTLEKLAEILSDNIIWDDNSKSIYMEKNPKYNRIKPYNVENEIKFNNMSYGYLPQIINPSDGESKINENILLILNDEIEDSITIWHEGQNKGARLLRNDYRYEIKYNKNNIFSVAYDRISTFDYQKTMFNSFGDTFYKDTGEKLQIEDILKGSKEDIEKIISNAYGHMVEVILKNTINHDYNPTPDFELSDPEDILNDYNFYIEDNDLVIFTKFDYFGNYFEAFRINIPDNANLFQENFLKNFSNM